MHTPPHLFGTVKSIDRVLEEETKHQIFGLMCRGDLCGFLLIVNVRLLLVCGCLLVVWGHMWSLVGSLLSFVVVACLSNYGQRTLHSKQARYLMFKQLQRDFNSQSPIS